MPGGSLCCFIVFFTHGFCFHALEAFVCKQSYGRTGGTIELSPDLPNKKLLKAYWKYNSTKVADKNANIPGHQFSGRVELNPDNYSLTITRLNTKDSGDFTFISATEEGNQSPTVCIRLLVQDALTQAPTLTVINTTRASNESCVAWLQCSTTQDRDVSYKWTVRDETHGGSSLQYTIRPQDGDITFNCTVANRVSETSGVRRVNCHTSDKQDTPQNQTWQNISSFVGILGAAGGFCVLIIIIVVIVVLYRHKRAQAAGDDLTVYADIEDVTREEIMKPCSVYETLDNRVHTVKPETHTVYDKIQFNRVMPGSTPH